MYIIYVVSRYLWLKEKTHWTIIVNTPTWRKSRVCYLKNKKIVKLVPFTWDSLENVVFMTQNVLINLNLFRKSLAFEVYQMIVQFYAIVLRCTEGQRRYIYVCVGDLSMVYEWGWVCVLRGQLEVVPRGSVGSRPVSTVSAGGSLGRGNRAFHLQHHQSSLSALHMAANHNSSTVDRRRSSLRVTNHITSRVHS